MQVLFTPTHCTSSTISDLNYDLNIETQTGHGAINSTHLIAFQKESPLAFPTKMKLEFPRTKKRKLSQTEQESVEVIVDSKKEPALIDDHPDHDEQTVLSIIPRYVLWMIIRGLNALDQTIPNLSGFPTSSKEDCCHVFTSNKFKSYRLCYDL